MTEWLLSGHNTQETTGISLPATMTISELGLNSQFNFLLDKLGGGLSRFDLSMPATKSVGGRLYMNISWWGQNLSAVVPFDPASLGAPAGLVEIKKPGLGQSLALGPRFYKLYKWGAAYYREELPQIDQEIRQTYAHLRKSPDDLDAIWALFEDPLYTRSRAPDRAHVVISLIVVSLDSVIRQQVPALLPLFSGQSTVTSQLSRRIWRLSQVAQASGPQVCQMLRDGVTDLALYRNLPEAAQLVTQIEEFLAEYGHRGFRYEIDFETDRLADQPEYILSTVASLLSDSQSPDVRTQATQQEALEHLKAMNPIARNLWQRVFAWGQQLIAWREDSKSYLALRQATHGLAMRLLARQFYSDQGDDALLFYTFDEFLAFVRSHGQQRIAPDVLAARRAHHEIHRSLTPPVLIWYDPDTGKWTPVQEGEQATQAATVTQWRGIPANPGPGPVDGIALVTNDPLDAGKRLLQIRGPVILITRLTDPAWSALFPRLGAVVTELGGLVSHATIVARENGLPAVVGVPDITRQVRDGQHLTVDGRVGTIKLRD